MTSKLTTLKCDECGVERDPPDNESITREGQTHAYCLLCRRITQHTACTKTVPLPKFERSTT